MSWFFLTCVVLLVADSCTQSTKDSPPRITTQLPRELAYKIGEPVSLACEADGHPSPSFEWRKDEQTLGRNGHVKWRPSGSGTIIIDEPKSADEGIYQCFARNRLGAAIGSKTQLRKAVLEPFPSIKFPKVHRPVVGTSFTLRCDPPLSYPTGLVYWGENKPGARLRPIEVTLRKSLDHSGNLHFSNIQPEDHQKGISYVCIVQNMALRSLVQGDDQVIQPVNLTGSDKPKYEPPQPMWTSSTKPVAIRGEHLSMKCIFSGYPTPSVNWQRLDGQLSSSAELRSFNQELYIRNVQFDDEGSYRCSATNSENGTPITKDFELVVESLPYWRQNQAPEDANVAEDEPAHVQCLADGKPKPIVSWFINGQPIEEVPSDPRRAITNHSISYSSVTKADIQVIQCNASNAHGYILANAYINVMAEPPSFIRSPSAVVKVAEGENVTLICRVFGAPKPTIAWKKSNPESNGDPGDEQLPQDVLVDRRFQQRNTGDLHIKNLIKSDSGRFTCEASNKFGLDSVSGELIVRERTIITEAPRDQVVIASTVVVFPCNALTDQAESANLTIEWHRNGEKIDYMRHPHLEHNRLNNSLIITGAEASDTANYTCHAGNGIDRTSATAQLIVRDRPDPPSRVWLSNGCLDNRAEVNWTPGNDNNDKIIEFIIHSNSSHDPPGRFRDMIRVPASSLLNSAVLNLRPWTNYSFHVTARNSLGESKRSLFTSDETVCSTPPAAPFRHPDGVCTVSRKENELVIVWQPMEPADHNGENFHYVVEYKQKSTNDTEYQEVHDWRTREIVVANQPTFSEYMIFVKAINSIGEAPTSALKQRVGYSGQGVPSVKPENFTVVSFNSSSATFTWKAVKENPDEIKGFFLGYRIKFWKSNDPENIRVEDVIMRKIEHCPVSPPKRRKRTVLENPEETFVSGTTQRLWAFSDISATVMVLNGAHKTGPMSDKIQFQTPEGVPDAVSKFEVEEKGSNHFVVSWSPPSESHGILTRYVIEFEEAPSGVILNRVEVDPSVRTKKITGLRNDTVYVINIRAATMTGSGPDIELHAKTNPSSAPSKPGISELDVGSDFVVVSWQTSSEGDEVKNPGSTFGVEYRPAGTNEWLRTDNTTDDSQVNITGLDKGATYEVRVIAFNDNERHSTSETAVVKTGQKPESVREEATGSFFNLIILASILFLIMFIICFLCYIHYNKVGVYPVKEREKKHGCAASKDDEPEFGEYVRPLDPLVTKSNSSISSLEAIKPHERLDSDNDSLAEYADPDPSKFNEDGSFIGQYGKKPTPAKESIPKAPYSTYI